MKNTALLLFCCACATAAPQPPPKPKDVAVTEPAPATVGPVAASPGIAIGPVVRLTAPPVTDDEPASGDPATEWLAGSAVAAELWTRLLRPGVRTDSDWSSLDDSMLVSALSYLPSVAVPPMDQLFLLFLIPLRIFHRHRCSGRFLHRLFRRFPHKGYHCILSSL